MFQDSACAKKLWHYAASGHAQFAALSSGQANGALQDRKSDTLFPSSSKTTRGLVL